jgi:hypothetical protein
MLSSCVMRSRSASVARTLPGAAWARTPTCNAVPLYHTSTSVLSCAATPSVGKNWENPVRTDAVPHSGSSSMPSITGARSARGTDTLVLPLRPSYTGPGSMRRVAADGVPTEVSSRGTTSRGSRDTTRWAGARGALAVHTRRVGDSLRHAGAAVSVAWDHGRDSPGSFSGHSFEIAPEMGAVLFAGVGMWAGRTLARTAPAMPAWASPPLVPAAPSSLPAIDPETLSHRNPSQAARRLGLIP